MKSTVFHEFFHAAFDHVYEEYSFHDGKVYSASKTLMRGIDLALSGELPNASYKRRIDIGEEMMAEYVGNTVRSQLALKELVAARGRDGVIEKREYDFMLQWVAKYRLMTEQSNASMPDGFESKGEISEFMAEFANRWFLRRNYPWYRPQETGDTRHSTNRLIVDDELEKAGFKRDQSDGLYKKSMGP